MQFGKFNIQFASIAKIKKDTSQHLSLFLISIFPTVVFIIIPPKLIKLTYQVKT